MRQHTTDPRSDETMRKVMTLAIMAAAIVTLVLLGMVYVKYLSRSSQSAAAAGAVAQVATSIHQTSATPVANVSLTVADPIGWGAHPGWIGYTVTGIHHMVSQITLPAHALIRMTIRVYDTPTPLRNPYFNLAQGTVGGTISVNGAKTTLVSPDLVAHTFAISDLGIVVPLTGVTSATAKHGYVTTTFEFKTGAPGSYTWQCFNPCGHGNNGPMGTIGYMNGQVVVA